MKPDNNKKKDQQLLWKLHHWSGLYAGIVIGILCFTGAIAVFIPEIDGWIQKRYYSVHTAALPAGVLPKIDRSLAVAKKQYPEMSGLLIDMPDRPGAVATFSFAVKGKDKASNKSYFLFVDPVQDKILGSRDRQNSLANYLRQIHVRLYESFWGRQLVGLAGVAFIILTVTGFLIYGNFMKKQAYPKIRRKGMRMIMGDWHKILGITALAFNFVIASTGAWLGLQPKLMQWFKIKAPNDIALPKITDPVTDAKTEVQWNEVFRVAKREFPDLIPGYIRASEDGTSTIEVHGSIAGQVYEKNINTLVLSKTSYQPVFKCDLRAMSFRDKFYSVQEALHFGDYGGLWLKIIYTILGLTSAFLSISGFIVYLYRTNKKQQRKMTPLKTTFLYSMVILIILVTIALISMLIGYRQAATVAAIIINGTIIVLILYAIISYIIKKVRPKAVVHE
jgi:uncharacterized iron-regulated membrane protein